VRFPEALTEELDSLRFPQRVDLGIALGKLDIESRPAWMKINAIRNRFVHDLHAKITNKEARARPSRCSQRGGHRHPWAPWTNPWPRERDRMVHGGVVVKSDQHGPVWPRPRVARRRGRGDRSGRTKLDTFNRRTWGYGAASGQPRILEREARRLIGVAG